MFVRRLSAALLIAGTALLGTAAPALAHTELKSSNPASGASLPVPPKQVTLTFNEAVEFEGVEIKVSGPGGAQWNVHRAEVKGPVVTATVEPSGAAGPYTMTWKVFADDGHPVTGKIAFTLTGPAVLPPSTTAPPARPTTTSFPTTIPSIPPTTGRAFDQPVDPAAQQNDDGNGVPVWLWILIAVVVIGAVVIVVLRSRRSKTSAE